MADDFDTFIRSRSRGGSGWEDAPSEQLQTGVTPKQANPILHLIYNILWAIVTQACSALRSRVTVEPMRAKWPDLR